MSYSFEIRKYVECSKEEKLSCVSVINDVVYLANVARREGILALESEIQKSSNSYLKRGILFVIDGIVPNMVAGILGITSVFGFKTGVELLKELIMVEGILSIQAGENPRIIEEKLLSFLGDAMDDARKILEEQVKTQNKETSPWVNAPSNIAEFEELVSLSNRDFQSILRETDLRTLELAVKICGAELRNRFFANMSSRLVEQIIDDMSVNGPIDVKHIEEAQNQILAVFHKLQENGDIVLAR